MEGGTTRRATIDGVVAEGMLAGNKHNHHVWRPELLDFHSCPFFIDACATHMRTATYLGLSENILGVRTNPSSTLIQARILLKNHPARAQYPIPCSLFNVRKNVPSIRHVVNTGCHATTTTIITTPFKRQKLRCPVRGEEPDRPACQKQVITGHPSEMAHLHPEYRPLAATHGIQVLPRQADEPLLPR